ncbi:cation:proton antiporter domain-containing protein [Massilia pseudoviolaceinigra]|uniref:cation:proton antiporter domain-containing protein n=1 Tax=Massilia pseudoviolaceinigra TaxID=3057165 RepID=UPI0027968716|nr:cation:proton antiporter [Massilia sp. CCM 9206]MDQ1919168.1 cation:proton antiporter [Massilia sp. CCM 9206]
MVGTLISAIAVRAILWWTLPLVGLPLSLTDCMLFGALISPTDPIAVMGTLKSAKAPESPELLIAGESLFNDGAGVALFAIIAGGWSAERRSAPRCCCCRKRAVASLAFCGAM